ncbi:hypothetical protein [Streptomyces sp. NPDC006551]|uniref:baeRF2 domain-containing protein n=1 Tax=Streptomyces sp. NPDC006551 TaxID=3157178 RepID=UPI0033A914C6
MELGFLKPLFDRPGPWASVYVETTRTTEDAAKLQQLRNRSVAGRLVDEGAAPATVRAVMDRLAREPVSGTPPGRALFATGDEVVLDLALAQAPPTEDVTWSTLPHVAPLVVLRGEELTCLVAYIDRTGADLELRQAHRRESVGQAQGKEWRGRGHRSIPADRYEWHYRNKVEKTWDETADVIASELVRQWPENDPALLVLTGDSRERRAVYSRLPQHIQAVAVEAGSGSRQAGSSTTVLDEQIEEACDRYERERLQSALDRFRIGRGRPGEHRTSTVDTGPGQAAEGIPAVVDAARKHQVATLLIDRNASDAGRQVWIGPGPDDVAVQRGDARAVGVAEPEQARADDALLRAAVAADCEVLVVPEGMGGPAGGLGAVLRWSD